MIYFLLQENGYEVPLICWIFSVIVPLALLGISVSAEIIHWMNWHKRKKYPKKTDTKGAFYVVKW